MVQAQGQSEAAALGQGCQGQGQGQGEGGSAPPPARRSPPPPPSVGGQDRHRSAAVRHGGAGQRVGQTIKGAPRSAGVRQPVYRPARGGGALEGESLHCARTARCTTRALRGTFRLCSPRRAPKQTPWKRP